MTPNPLAWVDSGVDYLTCTYTNDAVLTRLYFDIARVERNEIRSGNLVDKWGMSGYLGQRVGGLEFGTSHQGVIVRLSGPTAQRYWRRFGKLASNCSRIDIQQTVLYDEDPARTITRHFNQLSKHCASRKRAPEPKLWSGMSGAETVYSGKRVSDVMLRIYHRGSRKGHEDQRGHIRYEAEIKNEPAKLLMLALLRSKTPSVDIEGRVALLFQNRGCDLKMVGERPAPIRCPKMSGSAQRRLAWLASSVQPTVQALIEGGYGPEVAAALSLPAFPDNDRN